MRNLKELKTKVSSLPPCGDHRPGQPFAGLFVANSRAKGLQAYR
jgi:hypothetical protein